MSIQKEVLDKIRKCLELAKRGGTEGEAQAAMYKVQQLLIKHNLSISDVESHSLEEAVGRVNLKRNFRAWEVQIWHYLAKLYFCNCYWAGRSGIVIGKPTNVIALQDIANYVTKLGRKLSKHYDKKSHTSFLNGFADRIGYRCTERLREADKSTIMNEQTGKELVLASLYKKSELENQNAIAKLNLKIKDRRPDSREINDPYAYQVGWHSGAEVSLGTNEIGVN